MKSFFVARIPRIIFGQAVVSQLPGIAATYGRKLLLVTGASSFDQMPVAKQLLDDFHSAQLEVLRFYVSTEPSPELVDQAVKQYGDANIDLVIGFGGGSALDAAKAIAGLLKVRRSVMDYLEGVGPELTYQGSAVPFIAVPTTAGTGSEATKNAVLSTIGDNGFKKSFRDDKLVAEYALIDPDLLASCPKAVIAANGMDALTQVLESFVSSNSNVLNNSLGEKALNCLQDGLLGLYHSDGQDAIARSNMAYASMISGINLAQTGLGSVHGLASPLGAFFPIPHGEVCGTLVAEATDININAMLGREPDNPALEQYARAAELLLGRSFDTTAEALDSLVGQLRLWVDEMALPRLSQYGLAAKDFDKVVKNSRGSSMKTNPIVLSDAEIMEILQRRL